MSRRVRIASISVFVLSLSFYFVNCAGGLPDLSEANKAQSSTAPNPNSKPLTLSFLPAQINVSSTAVVQAVADGGTPPYTYTISGGNGTNGNATIDHALGKIGNLILAGSVVVQVTDANNNVTYSTLTVGSGNTAGPKLDCTTPWGVTLVDGGTTQGFAAATVNCPATCTPVTLTCYAGKLTNTGGATSPSCAVASCTYKQDAANICANVSPNAAFATSVPATCSAAEYHTYICVRGGIGGGPLPQMAVGEYHCVSPNEAP